eukprot:847389-Pelagomonas_calceolata.AAC.2
MYDQRAGHDLFSCSAYCYQSHNAVQNIQESFSALRGMNLERPTHFASFEFITLPIMAKIDASSVERLDYLPLRSTAEACLCADWSKQIATPCWSK